MRLKGKHVRDAAVKSLAAAAVWVLCSVCPPGVRGQEGDGCGHTVQGAESGTLASRSYPGTYPSNAWCRWRLRVPGGRTLRLLFGDFDVESSPGCGNGSVVVTDESGELILGPACGRLDAWQKNLTLRGNEASVTFRSGPHRSGRGFLLSYATDQHPELITCLQRGSHFSSQHLSAYCPAGCRDVTGDVWGNNELGYRDTSVLCKSAVHAGAVSDSLGGRVAVSRGRSLTLYESTFANGILSKMGSLSEKKLLFSKECNNILSVSAVNASSSWEKTSPGLGTFSQERQPWPAGGDDPGPWLELELRDRSSITGIVTTGTANNHMETFVLLFSKDRKNWKLYKGAMSKEQKVFTAYTDGHLTVLNSLFPPAVARFVRLQPLRWHGRASEQVQLLGCTPSRATPRSRSSADTPPVGNADRERTSPSPATTLGPVLVETRLSSSQPVIAAVGVVLALLTCGSCLLAGVWWRRRKKESQLKYSLPKTCQSFQAKSLSSCPQSDFISFPLERSVHDALPSPPLNDYAEPAVAAANQKMGSTFRPSSDEGYTTPFAFSHYDTPGGLPEYAEPLPPEPEYATPFSEQPAPESHGPLNAAATSGGRAAPGHAPYDCPSHRVLSNGYCTPAVHAGAGGPRPVSAVYAEPKSCDSVPQKHTYEKPL